VAEPVFLSVFSDYGEYSILGAFSTLEAAVALCEAEIKGERYNTADHYHVERLPVDSEASMETVWVGRKAER